jgi:hypothetical protein
MNDQHNEDEREQRSLTTDIAILLAPTLAVGTDHFLNAPKDEPPKQEVVLPPGVDKEK